MPRGGAKNSKSHATHNPEDDALKAIIVVEAKRQNFDPNLALAVAQRESAYKPGAENLQLDKDTGKRLSDATGSYQLPASTARDPHVDVSDRKNARRDLLSLLVLNSLANLRTDRWVDPSLGFRRVASRTRA